ncbi:MFS transporter [Opitutales bacterium]|jgi:MFS transporter, DHA1 family, inner membrane transport protein|nr:MFS transporter [Opitutales bacterium]
MSKSKENESMTRAWLFTFACIGFLMVIWLIDACLAALLPEIAEIYKGVTIVQGAQLVTVYNLGFMVSTFFFGPLGDVLERYKIIVTAACLFAAACVGFAIYKNFTAALAFRLAAGFCGGMLTVNLWSGLIYEVPKKHFNTAIGLMAGTRAYSLVLGLPLVMKLVDWIGWDSTFLILGVIILIPLLLFAFTTTKPSANQKGGSLNPLRHYYDAIRLPGILRGLSGFFLVRMAGGTAFVFTSLWLFETYGLDTSQRAILILVFGIGEILGSWASVPIISKMGPPKTFYLGITGTFFFLAFLVFTPLPLWGIGASLLLLSLSDRCFGMAFWRVYIPQDRLRTGTLSSMGNIAFAGSIAAITGIGTPIVKIVGWKIAVIMTLTILLIGSQILRFSLFTPDRLAKAEDGW